jgi:N-acetylglucosamine-6-phosphate deacetylase
LDVASAIRVLEEAGGRLRQALALAGASAGSPATGLAQRAGAGWAPRWKRLGVGAALVEGVLIRGDVAIEDGKVVAVGLPGAGSGVAIAGMVDLQVNGYAGVDAASASLEELETMGAALAADGVLAYQPTLISGDPEGTAAAVRRIGELAGRAGVAAARILGIHLEGPFLSPKRRGTHPLERLSQPDSELLERLLAAGPVTMVTIAPELGGAIPMIAALHRRGVVVSLGHSDASPAEASAAATAGASVVTHLYNGMAPISSRAAGLAGWALGDRRVGLQLIADGVHVADELLTIAVDAGPERVSLVTDATSVAGCSDGQMMLGDVPIELSRGVARGPDGTIAGGASRLIDGMRRLAGLSTSLEIALAAVTERPARILGRRDVGHLRPGAAADVVVLDDALQLRDVFVEGRSIHE